MSAGPVSGCTDSCSALCQQVGDQLQSCLSDWPATWMDLDASNRSEFVDQCKNQWATERADLEVHELDEAYDQCDDAARELLDLSAAQACDELRALYLD